MLSRNDREVSIFVVIVADGMMPTVTTCQNFDDAAACINQRPPGESYAYVFSGQRNRIRVTASGRLILETPTGDIDIDPATEPSTVPDGALFVRAAPLIPEPEESSPAAVETEALPQRFETDFEQDGEDYGDDE